MRISQREARRLRKRVQELEDLESKRANAFEREYPGIWIATEEIEPEHRTAIQTARKLGYAVAVQINGTRADYFAVPLHPKAAA